MPSRFGWLVVMAVLLAACGGTSTGSSDASRAPGRSSGPALPRLTKLHEAGGRSLDVAQADWVRMLDGVPWLARFGGNLVGLDPTTGAQKARVAVPSDVCTAVPPQVVAVRHGFGDLWLTDPEHGALVRMDPATGKVLARLHTGAGARFFDTGAGAVWVQNNTDGTVTRVDPTDNRVVATIRVDHGPVDGGDLAVGGGFVWARVSDALVAKIDPATNRVVARYGPAAGSGSVAADDHAVWISAHDLNVVYRLPLD